MSLQSFEKIYDLRPRDARLLGVDFGMRRIGVAVSNIQQDMATSVATIKRSSFDRDIRALKEIIEDYEAKGIIFGWPLNMDGSEGSMCERVRSFADELSKRPEIMGDEPWMAWVDERLSTQSVDEFLVKSVDMSRTKRKQVIDKLAAQKILQTAIDRLPSLERRRE